MAVITTFLEGANFTFAHAREEIPGFVIFGRVTGAEPIKAIQIIGRFRRATLTLSDTARPLAGLVLKLGLFTGRLDANIAKFGSILKSVGHGEKYGARKWDGQRGNAKGCQL